MTKLPFDTMRTSRADDGIGRVVYFGESTTVAKAFTNDDHFVRWQVAEMRGASDGKEVAIAESTLNLPIEQTTEDVTADAREIAERLVKNNTVVDMPTRPQKKGWLG